ncbi:MAG: hypothetical protein HQK53_16650 [Oligoflexia bacterium]|nr:hypothetical protein [Oligoflexia bacterium]
MGNNAQSTIEYLLLIAVIVSIMVGVFKSQTMQDIVGPDAAFFKKVASTIEHSYRHGYEYSTSSVTQKMNAGSDDERYNNGKHESYIGKDITRFFFVKEYPGTK